MISISPNLNIMIKAAEKASKSMIRDFGEVEKLQVSKKGPRDFVTKTDKNVEKILNKVKKITKTPIVAIGGINDVNYKNLLLNKSNFLAISGYNWKNTKYKPLQAVERLK